MVNETIDLLGKHATDKVTGATGVITSISFDLYGCVQIGLNRGLDKDGKLLDHNWYDVQRMIIDDSPRVMPLPEFAQRPEMKPATYNRGPAEKSGPR